MTNDERAYRAMVAVRTRDIEEARRLGFNVTDEGFAKAVAKYGQRA